MSRLAIDGKGESNLRAPCRALLPFRTSQHHGALRPVCCSLEGGKWRWKLMICCRVILLMMESNFISLTVSGVVSLFFMWKLKCLSKNIKFINWKRNTKVWWLYEWMNEFLVLCLAYSYAQPTWAYKDLNNSGPEQQDNKIIEIIN